MTQAMIVPMKVCPPSRSTTFLILPGLLSTSMPSVHPLPANLQADCIMADLVASEPTYHRKALPAMPTCPGARCAASALLPMIASVVPHVTLIPLVPHVPNLIVRLVMGPEPMRPKSIALFV